MSGASTAMTVRYQLCHARFTASGVHTVRMPALERTHSRTKQRQRHGDWHHLARGRRLAESLPPAAWHLEAREPQVEPTPDGCL